MATVREGNREVLLVVDVQVAVMESCWNASGIIANVGRCVDAARARGTPVVWVQHEGDEIPHDTSRWQLVPGLLRRPDEPLVRKCYNSSFEDSSLDDELSRLGATRLTLTGAATNWCIRSTAYGALDRGYDVILIGDAHSTHSMDFGAGSTVTAADMIDELNTTFRWLVYPGRTNATETTEEWINRAA